MLSVNRLLWLIVLLCMAALAISSIHSLTTDLDKDPLADDFYEEGFENFDYESLDESDIDSKHEHVQPPAHFHVPPSPPVHQHNHHEQQHHHHEQPHHHHEQPHHHEEHPYHQAPKYQPVPVPNYTVVIEPIVTDAYVQPAAPAYQQAYQQPAANYSTQAYQQPQPTYQSSNYTAPVVQQPAYQPAQQPAYQPAQQPAYQPAQQPAYQPAQQPAYQPAQQPAYQPAQQPAYQPAQQPAYQPAHSNNSVPVVKQPVYNQQQQPQQPYAVPAKSGGNYSVAQYQPPAQPTYSPGALAQKYSLADLAPFVNPINYRANHQTLNYYRYNVYRNLCPKQMYAHGPSHKDIEAAFAYAIGQVGLIKKDVRYMDASVPSFAARHQIFSFLNGQNARMDEEGLLVEFVGQFLADRLCLTKWDRQRYLPQLTKLISANQFPSGHSCSQYYTNPWQAQSKNCYQSKYRTYDGFCNNPYHPYWGKSNVCHIRLLSPDYADGIALPRESHNSRVPLPNPRLLSSVVHNDVPIDGPWNLMKMQWGQFINHDISNTALSSYDGLVDCCREPKTRGCWPIVVPNGDQFYTGQNVTCLNFIRSGACPLCELGPRQQTNKNSAFLDASHVYGQNQEQANQLRAFVGGQLRTSGGKHGEILLPISRSQEQCTGVCFQAGDTRVNQHPALTALHTLLLRNHNRHAGALAARHPNWNDETIFQEARRLNIAEYQMINYNEYFPIVFGPILSAYFQLIPLRSGQTQYNPKVDPTTWNEYTTATCRFGHSQISAVFGLYSRINGWGQGDNNEPTFRLKEWFMRPGLLSDGLTQKIINGLLSRPSLNVDPWITNDVRNHLYQTPREHHGGDLAATNVWRGRDHGIPGYIHYLEYCFNYKVHTWKDLHLFIPNTSLVQLRRLYKLVENVDLFTGGLAERHFPGADTGPTFACVNGIQYNHLKFGDRYYFEHANQAGSFTPVQLDEIRRSTLARFLCHTAHLPNVPQNAFLQPSVYNPLVNCSHIGDIDYNKF